MKRVLLGITVVVCLALPLVGYLGCSRSLDFQTAADMAKAQEAFDRATRPEDYLKVASIYAAARRRGVVSGAALYNEGNALMKAGQRGRAIAAYREATRYRPADPRLKANLDYALGPGGGAAVRRPLIGYVLFWQDWMSYPAKFHWAGATAMATFVLGLIALFWRRRWCRRLAVAGLAVTVLMGAAAGYDWHRFDYQKHGVIVVPEVVARKGNAESYQPKFTEPLVEGTEFTVVERRGDWLLVRLPGNGDRDAWIEKNTAVVY
ncbi:MAG: tetratricopeptide repeat protein [Pirellulales bacterium]|nr:tetratricopeptide repeat protein [Pirellulales bacterium]